MHFIIVVKNAYLFIYLFNNFWNIKIFSYMFLIAVIKPKPKL